MTILVNKEQAGDLQYDTHISTKYRVQKIDDHEVETILSTKFGAIYSSPTQQASHHQMVLMRRQAFSLPLISSRRMTQKENTSDFPVRFPLDSFSGAMHLQEGKKIWHF
jgi:hypothetical protein